jgi:hypothetical protein
LLDFVYSLTSYDCHLSSVGFTFIVEARMIYFNIYIVDIVKFGTINADCIILTFTFSMTRFAAVQTQDFFYLTIFTHVIETSTFVAPYDINMFKH